MDLDPDLGMWVYVFYGRKEEQANLSMPMNSPYYMSSDRCILQPHLGGLTNIAWRLAQLECLENIRSYSKTGVPVAPVNNIHPH